MPHQILRRKKTAATYQMPYSEPPVSSRLSALLRLGFYVAAFSITRAAFSWQTRRGHVIISDRGFIDFASDLTRARIPHMQLPTWLLRILTPKGLVCFLDAPPDAVVERKGELTLENAMRIRAGYLRVCSKICVEVLDGSEDVAAVFRQLLRAISEEYVRRLAVAAPVTGTQNNERR